MKHLIKKGRKLSRGTGHRRSLLRNLLTTLTEYGHLVTTVAKAKEVKREFDILVNQAKRSIEGNNFSAKRRIYSYLTKKSVADKLFNEVLPKMGDRRSGYLRFTRTGVFRDDRAENVLLEFVTGKNYEAKESKNEPKPKVASPRRPRVAVGKTGRKNK